jgi:hypothetical protein
MSAVAMSDHHFLGCVSGFASADSSSLKRELHRQKGHAMLNLTNVLSHSSWPGSPQLLQAIYLLSGVLMAAGYVGQIRKAWRQPQASLLAQSMPSWLLWTSCRLVALAYGIWVIGDAVFIAVVGLDVSGRLGVVLMLLRAQRLQRLALRVAKPASDGAAWRRTAVPALLCALLLPAFSVAAQTTATAVGTPAQQAAFAAAQQSLQDKRYAEAFGRLAALADQGHVHAAQLALTLYDYGPALLGQSWSATPSQQRHWFALAQPMKRARSFLPDTEVRE